MSVNGKVYDWESIEVQLPNGLAIGITDINYNDERPKTPRYGKGSVQRGTGRGNYKASFSLTLDRDEYEALRKALGGSVYEGEPFNIVVSYANDGSETISDTLPDCEITKQDTSGSQGDDNVGQVKLDGGVGQPIKWNGVAALKA
jgi:hypothetical protein